MTCAEAQVPPSPEPADEPVAAETERVLVVLPGRDGVRARELLGKAGFETLVVHGIERLCREMERGAGAVVLIEELLDSAAVAQLQEVLARQPAWSDLPLIILGRSVEGRQPPLAPLGKVTLVDRPVRVRTLVSSLESALRGRRRQYQARAAILARDQFLSMLGHELRNPLGAILMSSEVIKRSQDARVLARQQNIIERQVRHLTRLVDDLLEVSRVTTGKIGLRSATIDLGELIARCLESVETGARSSRLEIQYEPPPERIIVEGDADRLQQVFANLLTNAIKYTPAGGRIAVTLARQDGAALITVRDSGMGIAPEMLPRIFELFMQADSSLDRARGGMGIGLTLAKTLVELHGGTIRAESAGLGKGTQFIITLPLLESRPQPNDGEAARERAARPLRVLVVDDNVDMLQSIQAAVQSLGHSVGISTNGIEGLRQILEARPDVALIDIGLPGLDGYLIARQVRQALGNAIRLIAVTGYGQPRDRERAFAAGFDDHVVKPVDLATLKAVLGVTG